MCTSKNNGNSKIVPKVDINELPVVLTVVQVASVLGIGKNTAYDFIRSGAVKSVRVGRQIRVPRSAFLEF